MTWGELTDGATDGAPIMLMALADTLPLPDIPDDAHPSTIALLIGAWLVVHVAQWVRAEWAEFRKRAGELESGSRRRDDERARILHHARTDTIAETLAELARDNRRHHQEVVDALRDLIDEVRRQPPPGPGPAAGL